MPAIPQGIATFPGVERLLSASITLTHGIAPSVAQLSIAPQASYPNEHGTLSFSYDDVEIEFPNCKIDHATVQRSTSGEVCSLSILDRRWRWRFGRISGTYNARREDNSLQKGENGSIDTERTPQQLATLCLEAMGETGFDVADLPNDSRPSVEWDSVVPAEALAALCDQFGCRVVLQLDNSVALRRVGAGATIPTGGEMQRSPTVNTPELPDKLTVVGGPTRFQVDFPLEAVGLTDDEGADGNLLAPIALLDYTPSNGWGTSDPPYFHQVDAEFRALAVKSVFRYYRIKTPLAVPGYEGPSGNQVDRLEQILPIEDTQVAQVGENGQLTSQPAVVYGVWHDGGLAMANRMDTLTPLEGLEGSGAEAIYRHRYTIDLARGLVIFAEPIHANGHASATGGSGYEIVLDPAQLVLRATCSVRDATSLEPAHYERERSTGSSGGTKPRYVRHDELTLTNVPEYGAGFAIDAVNSNSDELDALADEILDAVQLEYQTTTPETAVFPGFQLIDLDGAIQQLSLSIGNAGTTTTISRGNEVPRLGRSYVSARQLQRQRASDAAGRRPSPRELAQALRTNPRTPARIPQ